MSVENLLGDFYQHLRAIYHLRCIEQLLNWDQQVFLPPKGAGDRSSQLELLSTLIHQRFTDSVFAGLTDELSTRHDQLSADDWINVRETKRLLDRERKLSAAFVAEKARVSSECFSVWTMARPANNFAAVKELLSRIVSLHQEEAQIVGYTELPYDALLGVYEAGAKTSVVQPLLERLGKSLSAGIPDLREKTKHWPVVNCRLAQPQQEQLCRMLTGKIGYDFHCGRLDSSAHPFSTTLGTWDSRITTRYMEENFLSSIQSALHEAGHALYELGLRKDQAGYPLGTAVSLGVHESQSRFWENVIGRSYAFSRLVAQAAQQLGYSVDDPDTIWRTQNRVCPSVIRVEADEVTYSLHVVIRMLLEIELISGNIGVEDLPGAWDELYRKYLGVCADKVSNGVLQDVHWYSGAIGYFPTYALGNIFGAMFLTRMEKDLGDVETFVERESFPEILSWLRRHVHEQGMRFHGVELIESISKQELSEGPFLEYLERKFSRLLGETFKFRIAA